MRLGVAAKILERAADTLRGLELRGVLPAVPRDRNGHRQLTLRDIERWRKILMTPRGTRKPLVGVAAGSGKTTKEITPAVK